MRWWTPKPDLLDIAIPQHCKMKSYLCLGVVSGRDQLLVVLIVDGDALEGGFEVGDFSHGAGRKDEDADERGTQK